MKFHLHDCDYFATSNKQKIQCMNIIIWSDQLLCIFPSANGFLTPFLGPIIIIIIIYNVRIKSTERLRFLLKTKWNEYVALLYITTNLTSVYCSPFNPFGRHFDYILIVKKHMTRPTHTFNVCHSAMNYDWNLYVRTNAEQ